MCDRDESWANLNTYQTYLNYRGKMRYKNYSSKEKKNLKQFILYIIENVLQATIHKVGSSWGDTDFHLSSSFAEMVWRCLSSTENRKEAPLGFSAK